MKSIIIFLLILPASILKAQTYRTDTDTLIWNSSQAISNHDVITLSNQFTTYGKYQIQWIQNGEETATYTITEKIGEWYDLSQVGQVEFKVVLGDRAGSIFFFRDAVGIKVRIDMLRNGINMVPFEFIVSNVQKSN